MARSKKNGPEPGSSKQESVDVDLYGLLFRDVKVLQWLAGAIGAENTINANRIIMEESLRSLDRGTEPALMSRAIQGANAVATRCGLAETNARCLFIAVVGDDETWVGKSMRDLGMYPQD